MQEQRMRLGVAAAAGKPHRPARHRAACRGSLSVGAVQAAEANGLPGRRHGPQRQHRDHPALPGDRNVPGGPGSRARGGAEPGAPADGGVPRHARGAAASAGGLRLLGRHIAPWGLPRQPHGRPGPGQPQEWQAGGPAGGEPRGVGPAPGDRLPGPGRGRGPGLQLLLGARGADRQGHARDRVEGAESEDRPADGREGGDPGREGPGGREVQGGPPE
mmetsp:Transcript_104688/g.312696  ORF Transcript_104688/g.312696 Transcript_104688/m.312696 type:complete len:217 (+) Transcript_104688:555-1205(+)